jgi:3-deoxy-manno-octulosonate cytidylyltransferase (CMP-KDO synthetase)
MKKVIVIPARYASTRLPGKPLKRIGNKPLIQWVYEGAKGSRLKDGILIATDDERIRDAALSFGADVVMTAPSCESGTERVYEAIKGSDAEIIVNLQGDEPFIRGDMIDELFSVIEKEHLDMATLSCLIGHEGEYRDPNTVKVVLDRLGFALYFSRSPIPYFKAMHQSPITNNHSPLTTYHLPLTTHHSITYKHIGIYGYSRSFLEKFVNTEKGVLEEAESLEQLRVLENGYKIKVLVTVYDGFGIDTEEDLERFAKIQVK